MKKNKFLVIIVLLIFISCNNDVKDTSIIIPGEDISTVLGNKEREKKIKEGVSTFFQENKNIDSLLSTINELPQKNQIDHCKLLSLMESINLKVNRIKDARLENEEELKELKSSTHDGYLYVKADTDGNHLFKGKMVHRDKGQMIDNPEITECEIELEINNIVLDSICQFQDILISRTLRE